MTCTKTGPKNDPFFNCRRKTKELSKKELSNVAPASDQTASEIILISFFGTIWSVDRTWLSSYSINMPTCKWSINWLVGIYFFKVPDEVPYRKLINCKILSCLNLIFLKFLTTCLIRTTVRWSYCWPPSSSRPDRSTSSRPWTTQTCSLGRCRKTWCEWRWTHCESLFILRTIKVNKLSA